ncbi:hypothetical protein ACIQ9P_19215 [Kitasatospora sp. NPDC094019]|uniref:hypothetical protein n=1 Tax=Kitasatospora sp. NPDC094019 TaxID=3364091 RepID=UPI0037F5CEBF
MDAVEAEVQDLAGGGGDPGPGGGVLQVQRVLLGFTSSPSQLCTRIPGSARCAAPVNQRARGCAAGGSEPSCSSGPVCT